MLNRVLIQKLPDGEFASPNCYIAWKGFDERGFEIDFFTFRQLLDGKIEPKANQILVGGAGAVLHALRKMGIKMPAIEDLPEPLAFLRGRKVWTSTLGDVRGASEQLSAPIFVKPLVDPKAFSGKLVSTFRDILSTAHLPDEMQVLISEVVNFISEWRFFILKGEVIGAAFYNGDPLRFPDSSVIKAAMQAWPGPSAYAIDLGVTDDGRTLLVEVNDGYSLGCLSLKPLQYSLLLQTRWQELTKSAAKLR